MKSTLWGIPFIFAVSFAGCQDPSHDHSSKDTLVDSVGRHEKSTSAGNLITTAMKVHYLLDVVFYPAEFIKENVDKPCAAFIAGRTAPPGRRMGHAGAIVSGGKGTAEAKVEALLDAGISVAETPSHMAEALFKVWNP